MDSECHGHGSRDIFSFFSWYTHTHVSTPIHPTGTQGMPVASGEYYRSSYGAVRVAYVL